MGGYLSIEDTDSSHQAAQTEDQDQRLKAAREPPNGLNGFLQGKAVGYVSQLADLQ
jgi:hypothetical protein